MHADRYSVPATTKGKRLHPLAIKARGCTALGGGKNEGGKKEKKNRGTRVDRGKEDETEREKRKGTGRGKRREQEGEEEKERRETERVTVGGEEKKKKNRGSGEAAREGDRNEQKEIM